MTRAVKIRDIFATKRSFRERFIHRKDFSVPVRIGLFEFYDSDTFDLNSVLLPILASIGTSAKNLKKNKHMKQTVLREFLLK